MDYGQENHFSNNSSSSSAPSSRILSQGWLLTRAAGVAVEAQGALAAGVPCKIRLASALASWAAVVVHRTSGITGTGCKSKTLGSLREHMSCGQPLLL